MRNWKGSTLGIMTNLFLHTVRQKLKGKCYKTVIFSLKKLRGLSPRENYTDRVMAKCQ
jgi:hypothetical protein